MSDPMKLAPTATENLAYEFCMTELQLVGATRSDAEQAWEEDPAGRKLYEDFARIHAAAILKEAGV